MYDVIRFLGYEVIRLGLFDGFGHSFYSVPWFEV